MENSNRFVDSGAISGELIGNRQVVRDFVSALSMPRGIDEEFMKLSFQAPWRRDLSIVGVT